MKAKVIHVTQPILLDIVQTEGRRLFNGKRFVLVGGRLWKWNHHYDKWEDHDGNMRSRLAVVDRESAIEIDGHRYS